MTEQVSILKISEKVGRWICAQEGCAEEEFPKVLGRMESKLSQLTRELCQEVGVLTDEVVGLEPACYQRLWLCVEYHWTCSTSNSMSFQEVINHLRSGPRSDDPTESILHDVVLSQGLEMRIAKAAEVFDLKFMPMVRAVARQTGGPQAVDRVENFSAELILPRETGSARIATYQGRTSLKSWLRIVVTRFCISGFRQQKEVTTTSLPEQSAETNVAVSADQNRCEGILRPVFREAVAALNAEDRLLITMLILDNVPQKQLASAMGINSGNVTRRRQRIIATIWEQVRGLALRHGGQRSLSDCLQLVLAGESPELAETLSGLLADSFRAASVQDDAEASQ